MVGNGATNWTYDVEPAFPATAANFNVIPYHLYKTFEDNDCHFYFMDVRPASKSPICVSTWARIQEVTSKLNWYDLYRPVDHGASLQSKWERYGQTEINGKMHFYKRGMLMSEYTPWAKHIVDNGTTYGDFFTDYMNKPEVRKAFNIPDSIGVWEQCSGKLDYHVQNEASYWIYSVLRNQIKIMFYSGDTDGAVPTWGSKQWIAELNWPVTEIYRPWLTHGQVSGYVQKYDGLEFWTVKGVGHMAPQWAREPVTDMITAFIHDEPL